MSSFMDFLQNSENTFLAAALKAHLNFSIDSFSFLKVTFAALPCLPVGLVRLTSPKAPSCRKPPDANLANPGDMLLRLFDRDLSHAAEPSGLTFTLLHSVDVRLFLAACLKGRGGDKPYRDRARVQATRRGVKNTQTSIHCFDMQAV